MNEVVFPTARVWLECAFQNQREWFAREIIDLARSVGIGRVELANTRRQLPIRSICVEPPEGEKFWVWRAEPGWPPVLGELPGPEDDFLP